MLLKRSGELGRLFNITVICSAFLSITILVSKYAGQNHWHSIFSSANSDSLHNATNATETYIWGQPITRLLFLKTHKTGGSTVCRLLFSILCDQRYQGRQQHCFVPPAKHAGRSWDLSRSQDRHVALANAPYDVWVHHARLSKHLLNVVPNREAVITIVRRPSDRFRSAWHWYGLSNKTGVHTLPTFVDTVLSPTLSGSELLVQSNRTTGSRYQPGNKYLPLARVINSRFGFKRRTGLDETAAELTATDNTDICRKAARWSKSEIGIKAHSNTRNSTEIESIGAEGINRRLLQAVRDDCLVVLILERLPESLVLLAHRLRWPPWRMLYANHKSTAAIQTSVECADYKIADVISSTKVNVNKCLESSKEVVELTELQKLVLDAAQPRDLLLYNAAIARHEELLKVYPGGRDAALVDSALLKAASERLQHICKLLRQHTSGPTQSNNSTKYVNSILSVSSNWSMVEWDAFHYICVDFARDNREAMSARESEYHGKTTQIPIDHNIVDMVMKGTYLSGSVEGKSYTG